MIKLRELQKTYPPDLLALDKINLAVSEGEFVFIAGASGAGKSTILKLILGAERATSGEIEVLGQNLLNARPNQIALLRRDIGVVFQDYKLMRSRTLIENVCLGLEIKGISLSKQHELAMAMLHSLGLETKTKAFPQMLSGGEQQRAAIARALIHKPRLILADEPSGNLDVHMTRVIFGLLIEANKEGVTVIVASHNLSIVEELNKRTIVLDRGKMVGDFSKAKGLT